MAAVARLRKRLAITATLTLVGILLSATGEPGVGGVMTVGALVSLLYNLHQFGRTGPA